VGWRERDYARWTDAERRRFLGTNEARRSRRLTYSTPPRQNRLFRTGPRIHLAPGAGVAVIVSLAAAVLLGQLPHSHPLVPALHFTILGFTTVVAARSTGTISLPTGVPPVGSYLTLHGQLPAGEIGTVTVEGASGGQPWQLLASVPTANGFYEARIALDQPGLLRLHVTYPDGYRSTGEVRVG